MIQASDTYGELEAYVRLRPDSGDTVRELSETIAGDVPAQGAAYSVFKSGGTGFETAAVGLACLRTMTSTERG